MTAPKIRLSRKRIIIAVAAIWFSLWLVPSVGTFMGPRVRLWRADGVWCAARAENGKIIARWYGQHCDPDWARQQPGQ
ncbi:MAG: hypothetical protein O2890_03025 [Cyanobacteria bacterium]|nr:hypothetical protein [Cyanobacteriota bacterium]